MRLAVAGAGAVGLVFGGRLARAGHRVTFLARGATLEALRARGLALTSVDGDLHLPEVDATDDPTRVGPVDVVLVAVKATQVAALAPSLAPLVGPATAVVPLQNGVEASATLAAALGEGAVLEGLCRVMAEQTAPGRVLHTAVTPVLEVGPRAGMPPGAPALARLGPLVEAVAGAGMRALVPADMAVAQWEKFLFIEPFGTVGAAARAPVGPLRERPETRAVLEACLEEVAALARAAGVALPADAVARTWERLEGLQPGATASMQRDLVAGRPSELEAQTGAVVRLARRHRVPAPAHQVLYGVLAPWEASGRPR